MLLVTSATEAMRNQRQVHVNGKNYTLSEFVGAMPLRGHYQEGNEVNDNGLPQGFLVTQPPGSVTPAHFHEPNQFQVFVAGGGRLGAKTATPLAVQYANGHTPYGPIVASETGVKYFTLRQRWDAGAKYLPASRDKLVKGNQRARVKGGLEAANDADRAARTEQTVETVFSKEADGLAGWLYRFGPSQACTLPDPGEGGGQYLLVTSGAMVSDAKELPTNSVVFVAPNEEAFEAVAGRAGLDLLVLQFPEAPK